MSDYLRRSYDEVPYKTRAHVFTHPDFLACAARFYGLNPPAASTARVLEIGCATGGNLLAMAQYMPGAKFTGIDLSPVQIDMAKSLCKAGQLTNATFQAANLLDVPDDLGEFDYIIAHGVYSWVPQPVREKVLRVCRRCLSPDGLAMITYNTLPGWRFKGALRDMMLYPGRKFDNIGEKLGAAKEFLKFICDNVPTAYSALSKVLEHYSPDVLNCDDDTYLVHEFLEENNDPFYFHEFAADAARHQLQFAAEAVPLAAYQLLPDHVRKHLAAIADDVIELEQYVDFFINRVFRHTILCRAELTVERSPRPDLMRQFQYSSSAKPIEADKPLTDDTLEHFETLFERNFGTSHVLTRVLIRVLYEHYPRRLTFDELSTIVLQRWRDASPEGHAVDESRWPTFFARCLQMGQLTNLLRLHHDPAPLSLSVSDRPRIAPYTRHCAEQGLHLINPFHYRVELEDLPREVAGQLDGRHDQAALVRHFMEMVKKGELQIDTRQNPRGALEAGVGQALEVLCRHGLLVG